jgi:hypothetical protein
MAYQQHEVCVSTAAVLLPYGRCCCCFGGWGCGTGRGWVVVGGGGLAAGRCQAGMGGEGPSAGRPGSCHLGQKRPGSSHPGRPGSCHTAQPGSCHPGGPWSCQPGRCHPGPLDPRAGPGPARPATAAAVLLPCGLGREGVGGRDRKAKGRRETKGGKDGG